MFRSWFLPILIVPILDAQRSFFFSLPHFIPSVDLSSWSAHEVEAKTSHRKQVILWRPCWFQFWGWNKNTMAQYNQPGLGLFENGEYWDNPKIAILICWKRGFTALNHETIFRQQTTAHLPIHTIPPNQHSPREQPLLEERSLPNPFLGGKGMGIPTRNGGDLRRLKNCCTGYWTVEMTWPKAIWELATKHDKPVVPSGELT